METIIATIATALALGAAAGLKTTAEQAITEAYRGLKSLLQSKFPQVNVTPLEDRPDSPHRHAEVQEDLEKAGADRDEAVLRQAKQLLELIESRSPGNAGAIGVDLERIKAGRLRIADVIATGGGVKGREWEVREDINIQDVRAGQGEDQERK